MIRSLLRALRVGASVQNPTSLKWAGVAVAVAIIALEVAKSYGVLADVSEAALIELVMAALVLYSQIASTEKIGVLPAKKQRSVAHKYYGDVPMRDKSGILDYDFLDDPHVDRLRRQSLPPNTDAPESRNSAGFPDGPFFGDS